MTAAQDYTSTVDTAWMVDAACRGVPSSVMFPEDANGRTMSARLYPEAYTEALALCADCGHHSECRAHWEDCNRPAHGVYFGTTPTDRKQDRSRR